MFRTLTTGVSFLFIEDTFLINRSSNRENLEKSRTLAFSYTIYI
jgi:hypothetical protein